MHLAKSSFSQDFISKKKSNPILDAHGVTNVQGDKYTETNGVAALIDQWSFPFVYPPALKY
jgi:hypothetical protein